MLNDTASFEDDVSLATRAAWLHFVGGLTQGETAARLNVPSLKAHRLIARASRDGLVRVFVDGRIAECVALEERLSRLYGLSLCEVAPDIDDRVLPLRALGVLGARFMRAAFERAEDAVIGIGHGRTLAACVEHLPRTRVEKVRFVSLLGGITRKFAATPFDVIHRLAERTGAEAYVMPVPFFLNSAEDRAVVVAQPGVSGVVKLAEQATLRIVGIGTVDEDASLASSNMIERSELDEVRQAGGRGEMLGHFFDAQGQVVETDLTARTMSPSLRSLQSGKTIAIAGGTTKVAAIRAVLRGGLLHGLLTDETTARGLAGEPPGG